MTTTVDDLMGDLLLWLARRPRPYSDVMDAWRTSCTKLPVWEEACERHLLERVAAPSYPVMIAVTDAGRQFLIDQGRIASPA